MQCCGGEMFQIGHQIHSSRFADWVLVMLEEDAKTGACGRAFALIGNMGIPGEHKDESLPSYSGAPLNQREAYCSGKLCRWTGDRAWPIVSVGSHAFDQTFPRSDERSYVRVPAAALLQKQTRIGE